MSNKEKAIELFEELIAGGGGDDVVFTPQFFVDIEDDSFYSGEGEWDFIKDLEISAKEFLALIKGENNA